MENINDQFIDDLSKEAMRVLETESANGYIVQLKTSLVLPLASEKLRGIADYGISKVQNDEDPNLASYFFVISALKAYPSVARDFFTDVMVHCEDQMSSLKNAIAIKEKYEKEIRPIF